MKTNSFITKSLLILSIIATIQPAMAESAVNAQAFSDVSASSPYYAAITDLKTRGIISGYPDGTFKPDQAVNRVEALKIILGAAKIEIPTDAAMGLAGFDDVDGSQWYAPYLRKALSMGIVQGYPDATFRPTQTVNLVENLKILIKTENIDVSQIPDFAKPYNDAEMNAWYSQYVEYANEKNLITADSKGNIYPNQGMTRGKLAELLYRLLFIQDRKLDQYPKGEMFASDVNEPIVINTKDLDVAMFKDSSTPVNKAFNATELAAAAQECGTTHADGYFDTLMNKMSGNLTTYTFVENKAAQANQYSITVMPNTFGYTDLASFKNDFDTCSAGAYYPALANSKWLVFTGSCGGALDDTNLPEGCSEIKAAINEALAIK